MAKNPYITDPSKQKGGFLDGVAGFSKWVDGIKNSIFGVFAAIGLAGSFGANGIKTVLSWIPGVNLLPFVKPDSLGKVVGGSAKDFGGNFLKAGGLDKIFAGVTFGARGLQAVGKFMEGDAVAGVGKVVRGAAEAAVVFANFSGLGAILELGTKIVTGKFMSEHVGNAAEGLTTKLLGGTKEEKARQQLQNVRSSGFPAAAVAVPAGLAAAGLAASQVMPQGYSKPLTVGGLPNANPASINAAPVLPRQVMPVNYSQERAVNMPQNTTLLNPAQPLPGMSPTAWQDRVAQQGHGPQIAARTDAPILSGDPRFMSFQDREMLRQQAAMENQNLTAV